jgi:hypothetical protein
MLSKDVRPQNPAQYLRGSSRRCPGTGQDRGVQAIIPRQETCRNAVCAREAYLAARAAAIARPARCPVRVHVGSDCAEPPQACQVGRPATANRPFVRCVSVASVSKVERKSPAQSSGWKATAKKHGASVLHRVYADFCNKICQKQTFTTNKNLNGPWRHRRCPGPAHGSTSAVRRAPPFPRPRQDAPLGRRRTACRRRRSR